MYGIEYEKKERETILADMAMDTTMLKRHIIQHQFLFYYFKE